MRVRYYADNHKKEENQEAIKLLKKVSEETELQVEITRVAERNDSNYSMFDTVTEEDKSDVYDRDFNHNQTLSNNLGDRIPSRAFKNRKGSMVFITGRVGITDDNGNLLWATTFPGWSDDGRLNHALNFLESVAVEGTESVREYLDSLEADSGPPIEKVIRNQFTRSGIIPNSTEKEVKVGRSAALTGDEGLGERKAKVNRAARKVDIVADGPQTHWIIEVKREYSAGAFDKALGQVIVSDQLYRIDNDLDESETQMTIVFGQLRKVMRISAKRRVFGEVVETANQYDIKVYVGVGNESYTQVNSSNFDEIPVAHYD